MLNVAVKEGGFGEVKEVKGGPIPSEQVLQNIRDSELFNLPIVTKQKQKEGSLVFVAGGPTLLNYIEEIRQRSVNGDFIVTSNNTYDFLKSKGIVANACFIFDPKEKVKDYVNNYDKRSTFYIATCCNKLTVENALKAGVTVNKVLIAYGLDDQADINLQRELYPTTPASSYLVGGTMTPLRAIPFASMLGYQEIEFYGLDSCFGQTAKVIEEGEEGYAEALLKNGIGYDDQESGKRYVVVEPEEGGYFYAYKKRRAEDIIVAEAGPRRFLTSPGFAYQAKQLVDWSDRLEGKIKITVHGDSLSSYLLKRHWEKKAHDRAIIGDKRWTDEYAAMQAHLHANTEYGKNATKNRKGAAADIVSRLIVDLKQTVNNRLVTVLDYGAGSGQLGNFLRDTFKGVTVTDYDPFCPLHKDKPEPGMHDMLTCLDVMEHVEEQCVENTLKFMSERVRYGAFFIISLQDAVKTLPDGRNAHVTVKNAVWWKNQISKYFKVTEMSDHGHTGIFLCEAMGAAEELQKEAA